MGKNEIKSPVDGLTEDATDSSPLIGSPIEMVGCTIVKSWLILFFFSDEERYVFNDRRNKRKKRRKRGQTNRNKNVYQNGGNGRNVVKRIPGKNSTAVLSAVCLFRDHITTGVVDASRLDTSFDSL